MLVICSRSFLLPVFLPARVVAVKAGWSSEDRFHRCRCAGGRHAQCGHKYDCGESSHKLLHGKIRQNSMATARQREVQKVLPLWRRLSCVTSTQPKLRQEKPSTILVVKEFVVTT